MEFVACEAQVCDGGRGEVGCYLGYHFCGEGGEGCCGHLEMVRSVCVCVSLCLKGTGGLTLDVFVRLLGLKAGGCLFLYVVVVGVVFVGGVECS